jgi:hypothetical protein
MGVYRLDVVEGREADMVGSGSSGLTNQLAVRTSGSGRLTTTHFHFCWLRVRITAR